MKNNIRFINKIIDMWRKPKIFRLAIKYGYDWDGDIIVYKGTRYVFDISHNMLKRV